MLRYDRHLRQALPIATGAIESARHHGMVDRLDIAEARWSVRRAEAILRLRSSGDLDDDQRFHPEESEHARSHAGARLGLRVIAGGASS